jgi:succinoglycan biosynthesis transport protein ExoP
VDPARHEHAALREYLRLAWRRKWLILIPVILAPLAATAFALRETKLYRASAQVLLSNANLAAQLTGGASADTQLAGGGDRETRTQADLARVPMVLNRTIEASGVRDHTPGELAQSSSVSTATNSNLLTFKVTDRDPEVAAKLASEYARQYTIYRGELDTGAIKRARTALHRRLNGLVAQDERNTSLYRSLVGKDQQLETLEALQTSNAYVVREASGAEQVQPRPARSALIGLGLGIFLGIGLAFLRETLDTRVRSADEVRNRLGLPLLARLPEPPRRLRSRDHLTMVDEPRSPAAETFRVLRTNLDFANLERGARSIMLTSALQGEGKSTTVANLGVTLARAGRHVVLADLDLRRPYLDRFFGIHSTPGITHVALGQARLDEALATVFRGGESGTGTNGAELEGVLEVLPAGVLPPDPGEFVLTRAVGEILQELAARSDLLLLDTPPLLGLGDAFTLSEKVDALMLIARLRTLRRPMLSELKRILDSVPATKLGFIVTAAGLEEGEYGYGYRYGYRYGRKERSDLDAKPGRG